MRIRRLHPWDLTPKEAIRVQEELRGRVEIEDRIGSIAHVAGVDIGIGRNRRRARAAVAVLSWPDLELVERAVAESDVSLPYVPGLLSFREIPVALEALSEITVAPDLILCDGQGYAHPRRFGLACHMGVVTDTPTVGVAKSRLIGEHAEPAGERGSWVPLAHQGEVIGAVLRTRSGVRPLYVSIGHRVSLETAVQLVLQATPRYRLPETTRQAHRLASERTE